MTLYIACFDISDDRARNRVGKLLLEYGDRVQESVFEIRLRCPRDLNKLCKRLREIVDNGENVRFYQVCSECRSHSCTLEGAEVAVFPAVVVV